jgi:hypothetical protein
VAEFISARVVTLRELFSGQFQFQLPWFQRAYAWDSLEAGRLLTHVLEASRNGNGQHPYFLGTLVMARSPSGPETALIDGQQRIMTLTILFAVLRDLESEPSAKVEMQALIAGDTLRFEPQEGCADFCRRFVQTPEATLKPFEDDPEELSEAEANILENRDYLKEQLTGSELGDAVRRNLFGYLADNCKVVLHNFNDSEEAWLWLQREEETRHRFNATDKAKTSLTLSMPARDREACGAIWDGCEALIGSADLFELLQHIRLLKRRRSSTRPVEAELARAFELNKGGLAFMQTHLQPAAERLHKLRSKGIGAGREQTAISTAIDRASWIDDQIWVPPALHWLQKHGDGGETARFFKRLERLVWFMRLAGLDDPKKLDRMIRLLADLDSRDSVAQMGTLDIDAALKDAARKSLGSETFDRKHFVRPILRLICVTKDADPGPFDVCGATIEHILPQGSKSKAAWGNDFPAKTAKSWAHRLGNLTLLSTADNHAVANRAWSEKRPIYAKSEYVLSREVADLQRWTAEAVSQRTDRLIQSLFQYWELTG